MGDGVAWKVELGTVWRKLRRLKQRWTRTARRPVQRRVYKVFGGALAAAKVSRARALVLEPRKTNGCSAVLLHVGSCPRLLCWLSSKSGIRGAKSLLTGITLSWRTLPYDYGSRVSRPRNTVLQV